MCIDPATLSMASMVLSGVKAVATLVSASAQQDAAAAAAAQANAQYERDRQAAEANYAQQMETVQKQYAQVTKGATDQMSVRAIEARKERARISVVAAESGLMGATTDRLVGESDFNRGTDIASFEANRRASLDQVYEEAKGLRANATDRVNSSYNSASASVSAARSKAPTLIGTGLQLAGIAAEAGAEAERVKRVGTRNDPNRYLP